MSGRQARPSTASRGVSATNVADTKSSCRGTILVVEDEPSVLAVMEAILKRQGFEVLLALDAEQAMSLWNEHCDRIDMLLTDVMLPGEVFGTGLGQKMQEEKPALRVAYTSGYNTDFLDGMASVPKDWVFIYKPFDAAVLIKEVRQLMALKQVGDSNCLSRLGQS